MKHLIGFEKIENIAYPHLNETITFLHAQGRFEYTHFRERGYFVDDYFKLYIRNIFGLRPIRLTFALAIDSLKLFIKSISSKNDQTIAIDNLAYVVASVFFKNVVLLSYDFVTLDQPRSKSCYQRWLNRRTALALKKNKKLIIQSESRLNLFLSTHGLQGEDVQVFYLPVSLSPVVSAQTRECSELPVLMQIGGINSWRSNSHLLIEHYQLNHHLYELRLHGYIDAHIQQVISQVKFKPKCSGALDPGDSVSRVIEQCDIGIISYNATDLNFFYVARASGQFVEFLRMGKPVIVVGRSELSEFVEKNKLGVGIDSFADFNQGIAKVKLHYREFSKNAFASFYNEFNIENYLPKLLEWLKNPQ